MFQFQRLSSGGGDETIINRVEVGGRGLFEGRPTVLEFAWTHSGNLQNLSVRKTANSAKIRAMICRTQDDIVTAIQICTNKQTNKQTTYTRMEESNFSQFSNVKYRMCFIGNQNFVHTTRDFQRAKFR